MPDARPTSVDNPLGDLYLSCVGRVDRLTRDLDDARGAVEVPALPEWTVRDTVAHLAGVCADVLDRRLDGAPGPTWTSRQVDERRSRSMSELLDEWHGRASAMAQALADARFARVAMDAWHHLYDLHGALGESPAPDPRGAVAVVEVQARALTRGWISGQGEGWPADLPALVARATDGGSWVLGAGEPTAEVRAPVFELARALIGRRSLEQLRAYAWSGDPERFLQAMVVFAPPARPLAV
ncbi:maleylpyruvate isomerase N-terminal domain-containing protein [Pilimelia columellifera]|uniref:Mycothiol-dependent maleylpyruvate isomerase metal-binding domain-containing protein n=1 Tax=Pilimelia columellifera subsp. columellifera TaxID=706583 RepID=A0ABN3MYD1_9ACTN